MPHREKVLIDGIIAPSVTEVLQIVRKPFLEFWRGKHGNAKCAQILRESQDIGKLLHEGIECFFRGDPIPEMGLNTKRMFDLFRDWASISCITPLDIERNMTSQEYKYHGTCDLIAILDGKLFVVDWKTSSMMDDMHGAQLAAYAQMYKEETGKTIDSGMIVRIDKKEDAKKAMEIKTYEDLPKYFDVFLHCLALHRFVNIKEPK